MSYAPKIVLQLPLSDPDLLAPFVEACIRDKVGLISVVGEGCSEIHDLIDERVVGDGCDERRFIMTSFHPDETVQQVFEFVSAWEAERGGAVELIKL